MTFYSTIYKMVQAVELTDGGLYYPHEPWILLAILASKLHLEKRPIEVHTEGKGIQYATGNDWLVQTPDGEIYVVPNILFCVLFEVRK